MRDEYPFYVRSENGKVYRTYAKNAADAAGRAEIVRRSPAVLVLRADEPLIRNRSWARRLLDWLES